MQSFCKSPLNLNKLADQLCYNSFVNNSDPYYKKTVFYKLDTHNVKFKVSQDLFSSLEVDHGTQRLLRTFLFGKIDSFNKVLDLGCGYGPIGIVLKKICPKAEVHMVDRDALAVAYASANAELNDVSGNMFCYGSLGYDSVKDTDFDLIVSNIPAKVGEQVLHHMITDAKYHLTKHGRVVIVVIDAINDFINKTLTSDETIRILYHKSWPGHHVYHYTFTEEAYKQSEQSANAFEKGEYKRQQNTFAFQGKEYTLQTTYHLSEFDQLSYDSQLLLSELETFVQKFSNILVFNPGQGYIPLAVMNLFIPEKLLLVDRDLQALTISKENLLANGYKKETIETCHQVGLSVPRTNLDSVIGVLPKKQELAVYSMFMDQIYNSLKPDGYCIMSSSSTVITRVISLSLRNSRFKMLERVKNKGRSVVVFQKK